MVRVTMSRNMARLSVVDCEKRWKIRQFCWHPSCRGTKWEVEGGNLRQKE